MRARECRADDLLRDGGGGDTAVAAVFHHHGDGDFGGFQRGEADEPGVVRAARILCGAGFAGDMQGGVEGMCGAFVYHRLQPGGDALQRLRG